MLKQASVEFVDGSNKQSAGGWGSAGDAIQTGKMTLINKKKPSLEIQNKRPLTVSSIFLSVIAKLIKKRMDPI